MEFSIDEMSSSSISKPDPHINQIDPVNGSSRKMENQTIFQYQERVHLEGQQNTHVDRPSYEEVRKHCDVLTESLEILEKRYIDLKNAHNHIRKTNALLVERLLAAQIKKNAEKAKEKGQMNTDKETAKTGNDNDTEATDTTEKDPASKKRSRSPIRVRIVEESDMKEPQSIPPQVPVVNPPELNSPEVRPSRMRSSSPSKASSENSLKWSTQNADQCGPGYTEIAKLRCEVGAWWSDLRSQEVSTGKEIPGIRKEVAAQADQLRRIVSLLRRGLKSTASDSKAPGAGSSQLYEGCSASAWEQSLSSEAGGSVSSLQTYWNTDSLSHTSKVASTPPSPSALAAMYIPGLGIVSTSPNTCHLPGSQREPELISRGWAPGQILRDGRCQARQAASPLRVRSPSPVSFEGSRLRSVSPVSNVQVTRSRSISPGPSVRLLQHPIHLASGVTVAPVLPSAHNVVTRSSLAAHARKVVTVVR